MKKVLKWTGILLFSLLFIAAIAVFVLKSKFEKSASRQLSVPVQVVPVLSDSIALLRGMALAASCQECHGRNFAGTDFIDDKAIGYIPSSNLTGAKGSATEKYTDKDWVAALRYGINPQGRPLMIMPSQSYCHLSDEDLGALIGFLKTVKEVETPMKEIKFTLFGKVLGGSGALGGVYSADVIDFNAVKTVKAPTKAATVAYGKYIADFGGCEHCHGEELNGGKTPVPLSPPPSNITKGGNLGNWSMSDFVSIFKTGRTPEGKNLNQKFMPWTDIAALEQVEIEALYTYLQAQPAKPDSEMYKKAIKTYKPTE